MLSAMPRWQWRVNRAVSVLVFTRVPVGRRTEAGQVGKARHRRQDFSHSAECHSVSRQRSVQMPVDYHPDNRCPNSFLNWKALFSALNHHSYHLERKKTVGGKADWKAGLMSSVFRGVAILIDRAPCASCRFPSLRRRKLSKSLGIVELLSAPSLVRVRPYIANDGPLCSFLCNWCLHELEHYKPATDASSASLPYTGTSLTKT